MEMSLKTGFAQIFSFRKIWGGGGGAAPLVLPACTPMFLIDIKFSVMFRSAFGK